MIKPRLFFTGYIFTTGHFYHLFVKIFLSEKTTTNKGCDNTTKLTKKYLKDVGQKNIGDVLKWMRTKGGYCDCEIVINVLLKL
jgi:hypothetical protein